MPSAPSLDRPGAVRLLWSAVALGVALRALVIAVSHGSNDMDTWTRFADFIREHGIEAQYRADPLFNHPPLMGWMAAALRALALDTGIEFRILFKLPPLLADLLALRLIWSVWRPAGARAAAFAAAVFACNPVSVLVTAFHGNTDSLCAVMMLCGAILHTRGSYWGAGLAIAAAVNVKLPGVFLVPAALLLAPGPRAFARVLGGLAIGATTFLLPLCAVPEEFARNVLGYRSYIDYWGINVVGLLAWESAPRQAMLVLVDYNRIARFVILGAIVATALWARRRRWSLVETGAFSIALFLLLSSGFGVQYLVWLVPLLAAHSTKHSLRYAVLGGAFATWIYQSWMQPGLPLRAFFTGRTQWPIWLAGVATWAAIGVYLAAQLTGRVRDAPGAVSRG